MTTTSFRMNRPSIASLVLTAAILILLFSSCKKSDEISKNKNHASSYSSNVLDKWVTLQLRLMRNATGIPNHGFSRHFAYTGVAALESLAPGMQSHTKWSGRWNSLTGLPATDHAKNYYYPASVNAAMAAINRSLFPAASSADKAAIDSLENVLKQEFLAKQTQSVLDASARFGTAVATAVFNWAESDGYKNANSTYTPLAGPGLWEPTAPGFAPAATPYWGNNRAIIYRSTDNTPPAAPLAYSTDPASPFYQMAKQVYEVSQNLTDDQKAMAMFWRDVPGPTTPGHWLSIVQQVIRQTKVSLDKAALAYALTGTAINDALISCFETKYQYNPVRPSTYITEVMGYSSWTSYIGTPAHPEYSSAHAALSSAAAAVLETSFGNIGSFTDHTNDYLGFAPRTYSSLTAIGEEAAKSRLYAGIHYQFTIDASIVQGRKVTANIFSNSNAQ